MISDVTRKFAMILLLLFAGSAQAQVCKETNGNAGGAANLDCDMAYRNAIISCDKSTTNTNATPVVGTRPACPKKPMPMIDTPMRSYIADYSPYLLSYPRDATDHTKPYAGAFALGTQGDTTNTFQLFGNTAPGTKRLAACTTQILVPNTPTNPSEDAKVNRLQMDNCTNQYILNAAIYPFQKENVNLLSMDDPSNLNKRLDLAGECQPLRTTPETTNEYSVSDYLKLAWQKTLQDPNVRKLDLPSVFQSVPCSLATAGLPCDREPHYPNGTTIQNPLPPPNPFPDIPLSTLSAIKYEEILDPTHPFSPRWDFIFNDRQYSNPDGSWLGLGGSMVNLAANYAMINTYLSQTKDTIFCAGIKNADKESDSKKKKEDLVPVDVMEWRRAAFEDALLRRSTYNFVCYEAPNPWTSGQDAWFYVAPLSYCYEITGYSYFYPWVYAKGHTCWECFGLDGQVDDEKQHPPCTENYLGSDLSMTDYLPGGFNLFSRKAQCNYPLTARDSKYNMDKVCRDLRKPYTQINRLKMRYHNPDDSDDSNGDNNVLWDYNPPVTGNKKNGVQEGFAFKDYFDNHMPYPKLWDIGTSLRKTNSTDGNDQPPLDTTGQYTAIVGVGREAAAKVAANNAPADANGKKADELFPDQRCKTGGWGGFYGVPLPVTTVGGMQINLPDPITSWTETKLYQTRTLRNLGMSCIARYEKVFKPGSSENMLLLAAGAEWSRLIVSKCPRTTVGQTSQCSYMTLKEYTNAGNPKNDDSTLYLKQMEKQAWPNSWRGYIAANNTDVKYPAFSGDGTAVTQTGTMGVTTMLGTAVSTGLDNAKLGDIVVMPRGPNNALPSPAGKPGLAKLAMVIEINLPGSSDCATRGNCYVRVLEADNGKWPDSCGTTDTWGEMKSRYYYKPGMLPLPTKQEYARLNNYTTSCEETKFSQCEMTAWNQLQLYHIASDKRSGCTNKINAADCAKDE